MDARRPIAISALAALALAALGGAARAAPLDPWLDAAAASEQVAARFDGDAFSYPSQLLGRPVLVEALGYEELLADDTLVTVRVRADARGDLDADGLSEAALVVTEERCWQDRCESYTRLDVWSVRGTRVTVVGSWPLASGAKSEWTDVYIRDGVLRAWRHLCCLDDEGLSRDDEHRWRFDGLLVRPVAINEGAPYYPDEEGC